jgi:hypothetical protein
MDASISTLALLAVELFDQMSGDKDGGKETDEYSVRANQLSLWFRYAS